MFSGFSIGTKQKINDMSNGANFILNEGYNLIAANNCFFEITGLEYDIIEEGINFLSLIPDEEVLFFINFFKYRLNDPYNLSKTSEFRIFDSKYNEHKMIITAARVPETRRVFMSSIEAVRYFSQLKSNNLVAAESVERPLDQYFHFSYLAEHQHEPVFVLVGDAIAYINKAGIRLFGKENRNDLIGKSPLNLIKKSSREKMARIFSELNTKTKGHPVKDTIAFEGGYTLYIEISSVPVIYEGLTGMQYLIRDISSLKRPERMAVLRLWQIEIVNSVLKSAATGFSLEEILENILERVIENFEFQSAVVYLKDNDTSKAQIASDINIPVWFKDRYSTINIREWPYNIIFYGGQPRYVENLPDKSPGVFDIKILEDLGAISYAGIPLFSEKAVVGVLYVTKDNNSGFSPFEKSTLEEIGKEAGAIVVKGIIEERFENEYNTIRNILGIALKENQRIWNTIISKRWDFGDAVSIESNPRMELIKEIGPRMDIINNLCVIYNAILEENSPFRPVCLDSVIRGAIYHFADADVEYDRALYFVLADDNLAYVFINLFNMFRLDSEKFLLRISHKVRKDEISVIISDINNSKTIDNIEDQLNIQTEDTLRPANLPINVIKMLISSYGGFIRISVPEDEYMEEKSIVITLKRYGRI